MSENKNCQFLYDIDLFGKTPELYFQRRAKKSTELGIVLTFIYVILYIAYLVYKLIVMVRRENVTFYDTYAYKDFPSIHITNEEFYGAFMLGTGIDETIYYPKGQFVYMVKTPNGFVVEREDELEVEVCDINKFGKRYQEMFKKQNLDNLYCMKKVDGYLEGYANLERYSYISVQFYPCVGKTKDGRDCMPEEYLKQYLALNIIEFKMQDNLLSPDIYKTPVQALEKDISTPVFLDFYQYIYSYIQIVILETDDDITGLNFFAKDKVETYPKYDESYIITAPSRGNVLENGEPLCEVNLQLAAKVLTTKRKYMTLIDVLGDVGGLMELIRTVFNIIATFLTEISYDKSLVNNLFSFNLDKKEIYLKKKMKDEHKIKKEKDSELFSVEKDSENRIKEKTKNNLDIYKQSPNMDKNCSEHEIENELKDLDHISIKKKGKKQSNKRASNHSLKKQENDGTNKPIGSINVNESNELNNLKKDQVEIYKKNSDTFGKEAIIKNIKMNICCYCFLRKKTSIDVNLLDEGLKIITKRLDIMNIFTKIYQDEKIQEKYLTKSIIIPMSDKCIYNLDIIRKENERISEVDNG